MHNHNCMLIPSASFAFADRIGDLADLGPQTVEVYDVWRFPDVSPNPSCLAHLFGKEERVRRTNMRLGMLGYVFGQQPLTHAARSSNAHEEHPSAVGVCVQVRCRRMSAGGRRRSAEAAPEGSGSGRPSLHFRADGGIPSLDSTSSQALPQGEATTRPQSCLSHSGKAGSGRGRRELAGQLGWPRPRGPVPN